MDKGVLLCECAYLSTIDPVDFSKPYRVISPTLEGPILHALAGVETELTRSQIVNLVEDASEAGVRKALARLVEQGIVIEERIGSRYTYQVNRAHLLWPSVEGLLAARQLLRERVQRLTADWEVPPVSVELFGSVAQGTAHEGSDIDIIVIQPPLQPDEEDAWDRHVGELHDSVVRWTGNSCDIVVMDTEELHDAHERDEPILRSPASNLAGVDLSRLVAASRPKAALRISENYRKAAQAAAVDTKMMESMVEIRRLASAQYDLAALLKHADLGLKPETLKALSNLKPIDPAILSGIAAASKAIESKDAD